MYIGDKNILLPPKLFHRRTLLCKHLLESIDIIVVLNGSFKK